MSTLQKLESVLATGTENYVKILRKLYSLF